MAGYGVIEVEERNMSGSTTNLKGLGEEGNRGREGEALHSTKTGCPEEKGERGNGTHRNAGRNTRVRVSEKGTDARSKLNRIA